MSGEVIHAFFDGQAVAMPVSRKTFKRFTETWLKLYAMSPGDLLALIRERLPGGTAMDETAIIQGLEKLEKEYHLAQVKLPKMPKS